MQIEIKGEEEQLLEECLRITGRNRRETVLYALGEFFLAHKGQRSIFVPVSPGLVSDFAGGGEVVRSSGDFKVGKTKITSG